VGALINAILLYATSDAAIARAQADAILRGDTVLIECLDCNSAEALADRLKGAGAIVL
jgi:hypothetical protein